jgi:hypothetical protein
MTKAMRGEVTATCPREGTRGEAAPQGVDVDQWFRSVQTSIYALRAGPSARCGQSR